MKITTQARTQNRTRAGAESERWPLPDLIKEGFLEEKNSVSSELMLIWASQVAQQNLTANAGDMHSIPELGRSPGGGNGNPLQYSCLENPMDGGAWQAIIHGFAKSQIPLSD